MKNCRLSFSKQLKYVVFLLLLFYLQDVSAQCTSSGAPPIVLKTFGAGTATYNINSTKSFGFSTTYLQESGAAAGAQTNDGEFSFINKIIDHWNVWHGNGKDHTGDPNGYMMLVNADYNPGEFYRDTVSGLCTGVEYEFSVWIANVYRSGGIKPNVKFEIRNPNGNTLITDYKTGDIPNSTGMKWVRHGVSFSATSDKVILLLINNNPGGQGNDLALDDIAFTPCVPKYSISGVTSLCEGENLSLTANPSAGTYTNPEYQWQRKIAGAWQNIASKTSASLTKSNVTLPDTGWYRILVAGSGKINSVNCRTVDSVHITITPKLLPGKINSSQTICYNTLPNNLTNAQAASGGTGTYIYNWEYSSDKTSWTGAGIITTGYNFSLPLQTSIFFRRKVESGCYTAYSDTVKITVLTPLVAGQIGTDQALCEGKSPALFTETLASSGGKGTHTYVWESSTNNTTWTIIPSEVGTSYQASDIAATTWYRRKTTDAGCDSKYSNSVKLTYIAQPNPPTVVSPIVYFQFQNVTPLTATGTGTLNWYTTASAVNSVSSITPVTNLSGSFTYYVSQSINGCESPRVPLEVKVVSTTIPGVIASHQLVCDDVLPKLITETTPASGAAGGGMEYAWEYSDDSLNWVVIAGATSTTYQPDKITANRWFRRKDTDKINGLHLVNTSFEAPNTPTLAANTYSFFDATLIEGWNTTASDNKIEIWRTPFNGISAANGNQFAELNASQISRLFQYVYIQKGSIITWNFKHRGRNDTGSDVAELNLYSSNGSSKIQTLDTASTEKAAWKNYSGEWLVTIPSGIYEFSFEAITTASGDNTIGNFLDDIHIEAAQYTNIIKLTYQKTPAPITSDLVYCQHAGTTTLTVTGQDLRWYSAKTGVLGSSTAPINDASISGTFTYFVTQTIKGCESLFDSVVVDVNPTPKSTFADVEICKDMSTTLSPTISNATGAITYSWSPATGLSSVIDASVLAKPSSTTTYKVDIEDSKGCKTSQNIKVTVNPKPTISVANKEICKGESILLASTATNATGAISYLWKPSIGLDIITTKDVHANPSITTTYTLEISDAKGCKDTTTSTVTVNDLPQITLSDDEICEGFSTNFSPVITGSAGTFTYSWSPAVGLNTTTAASVTASPTASTTYTLKVTDSKNCKAEKDVVLTVNPKPIISIKGGDICSGIPTNLSATTTHYTGSLTYVWTPSLGLTSPNADNTGANPTNTTSYSLEVTDTKGCKNTASTTVGVTQTPVADLLQSDTILCPSQNFILNTYIDPVQQYDVEWFYGTERNTLSSVKKELEHTVNEQGYYVAKVTNNGFCPRFTDTIFIEVERLSIKAEAERNEVYFDEEVKLHATGSDGVLNYTWLTPLQTFNQQNAAFIAPEDAWYEVVGKGKKCTVKDQIYITVLPPILIPNGFSPNGDGKNDAWFIKGLADFPDAVVTIFNRWGSEVYRSNHGYTIPWEGTNFVGDILPLATYYYVIEVNDRRKQVYKGNVTILR